MRIVSGHQPVYLPWLGLIHKLSLADVFIFMDDVDYAPQDWMNRNQVKTAQGGKTWLTVPVDLKNSVSRKIKDILIKDESKLPEKKRWYAKHWSSLQSSYGKAPFFKDYKDLFESFYFENEWSHLAQLNLALLKKICEIFHFRTEIVIGSEQGFTKKKSDLVLEHGERFRADVVVTGIHGRDYIETDEFTKKGIKVIFQNYQHPVYEQKFGEFIPNLAFVDLLFQYGPKAKEIALAGNLKREEISK